MSCLLCKQRPFGKMIAVILSVYGDESADETKSRTFAVAGLIGNDSMWEDIQGKWIERTGGLPFHANNCDSDQGHYAPEVTGLDEDDNHRKNKKLYADLSNILADSELYGWGVAIDLMATSRVLPGVDIAPYYKGLMDVVYVMKRIGSEHNARVKFTFDNRKESEHNAGTCYGMIRETPNSSHMFPEISFVCSRDDARIQVADLFAREVMKDLDNVIGPTKRGPRKSWLALKDTGRFTAEALRENYFLNIRNQMSALQAKHGEIERYQRWIKDNGLQENHSNMFRYVHSVLPNYIRSNMES